MSSKITLTVFFLIASLFALNAFTLDGLVMGGPAGGPVGGASVELRHGNQEVFETNTDEAGYFILEELEGNNYMLHVEAEGFSPYMEMLSLEGDMTITIELIPGGNPGELTGHLFGVVTYESGELAAGLELNIHTYNPNTQPHYVAYETVTGDDGSYDFTEILDFANYNVMVMLPDMPFVTEVYVEGETEFNFVIEEYVPGETYSLSGTVTNSETGYAVAGIEVSLHGMQGIMLEAVTDEAGYYYFAEVLEGNYNLVVHGWNTGFEQFMAEIEIVEDTVFDIALIPVEQGELTLSGLVTDAETGAALPGIMVMLHAGPGMNYTTETAEDGTYIINGIFAGEYELVAHSQDQTYMHFETEIEILEDTVFDIELEAYPTGDLTLSGTITDEDGVAQAGIIVHLFGENIPGNMFTGVSNEAGYYEISGIFTGVYQIIVMGMQGMVLYEAEIEILEDTVHDIVLGGNQGGEGSLSGYVYNAETNEAIAGALIYLQHGWETYEAVTDEAGFYNFAGLAAGNYHVTAGAEGFEHFSEMIMIDGDVVLDIVLVPYEVGDYMLSGTVTDAVTGDVIENVHIQLFSQNSMAYMTTTNDDGFYEINGIFDGTYQLMAWTMGWSNYEPFDATIDIFDNVVFNFSLEPVQTPGSGSVSGTVYDADSGDVIPQASLYLASINGGNPGGGMWNHYHTNTDENGNFVIDNVAEGEYILSAEAEDYLISYYDGATNPEEATVISITENIEVVVEMYLTPLVFYSVSGIVMDYVNSVPLEGALVHAMTPGTGCNQWAVAIAETDENGAYVLEVPQGDYIFAAEFGENNPMNVMRQFYDHKQSPASADVVTVNEDITGIDFDLALQQNFDNSISGTVTVDGLVPENPVLVAAVSGGGNHWEDACVTDMFGNYMLNNLPEGDYYILAYEFASVPTYYPGVIDFQDAVAVTAAGNVTGIDFELIMPERNGVYQVDGYVTDHNDEPVANSSVVILDDAGIVLGFAVTNNTGYYLVDGLPSGSLTGIATKVLYETDQQNINVTTTGAADFVIIPEGTTDAPEDGVTPIAISLSNYPNPFNPVTTISFNLTAAGYTTLDIYNITGQKIKTLINNNLTAGDYQIIWDGTGRDGQILSSGMYFYRLSSGEFSATNKMVLMK
ncbi:MAG: carboxypeptidase regulatory-like domain-containing protein [Candidatus Cloacimonetes bacterium]|nr:carboxypeptidase regulatory-like domain-containing protein [Candidatus Cloacimonadota bacterium]